MLQVEAFNFSDCLNLWSVDSTERLLELRAFVLEEQKKPTSPWFIDGIPISYVHDPKSKDGQERIREAKERIGQATFRKMIFGNYQSRCCITGLDHPTLNRASHIIGWAEREATRMLPSNGLCLSATYDAAFDKHLISLDEDYRLIISKEIREHYSNASVRTYFETRQGQTIEFPTRDKPKQAYLEVHRKSRDF